MKVCTKCNGEKEDKEYNKNKTTTDGLCYWCKVCCKEYREQNKDKIKEYREHNKNKIKKQMKEYRKQNKDKIKEYREHSKNKMKEWYKNNKDKIKEYRKEYYEQNKDKIKKQTKEYRKNNIKKIKNYRKKHYKNNVEKIKEYVKEWCNNNTEKIKEQKKEYYKSNVEKIKEYRNSSTPHNTFAHQISYAEEIRRDPDDGEFLQVKCTYCKEWFNPTTNNVQNRIAALEGRQGGEARLYCSDECKKLCPVHYQQKYPKGQKPYVSRDIQAQWAEMVKERDGYKCIKCGSTEGLIAHHREGIRWNPLESADIDMGVTLCEECNKKAHSIEGCSYSDMRCPT